jgi:hypothetical protein
LGRSPSRGARSLALAIPWEILLPPGIRYEDLTDDEREAAEAGIRDALGEAY